MSPAFTRFAVIIATLLGMTIFIPEFSTAQSEDGKQEVIASLDESTDATDGKFFQEAVQGVKTVSIVAQTERAKLATILMTGLLVISQLLVQLTKTSLFGRIFHRTDGRGKLTLVAVCTVLTTFLPLVLGGVPIVEALMNGAVLTALAVAGHQLYKEFFKEDLKRENGGVQHGSEAERIRMESIVRDAGQTSGQIAALKPGDPGLDGRN